MTKQELQFLLDFDLSKFDEPENADEKLYLSYLTTFTIKSILDVQLNYRLAEEAKEEGKENVVRTPSQYGAWFRQTTLREKIRNKFKPINPAHKELNTFLETYEKACKSFLTIYDASYENVAVENAGDYYTVNLCNRIRRDIVDCGELLNNREMSALGYVDLRMPIVQSLNPEKPSEFQKVYYEEYMRDDFDVFESSLSKYISKYASAIK